MKPALLLALSACLGLCLPAVAQPYSKLWENTNNVPVTTTNPLPVTLSGGSSALVGVKGADGSTITSNTNPLPVKTQTVTQANITSLTANIPNVDTARALTASSTHLTVKTDPAAAVFYVDLTNSTATTSSFRIDPGSSVTFDGLPGITSIHVLGASATGTYSVAAW